MAPTQRRWCPAPSWRTPGTLRTRTTPLPWAWWARRATTTWTAPAQRCARGRGAPAPCARVTRSRGLPTASARDSAPPSATSWRLRSRCADTTRPPAGYRHVSGTFPPPPRNL
eukprot:3600283-Pyramimonas_sp.AAC.3